VTPSVSFSWQLPATESICSLVSPGIAEWHAPGGNPLRGAMSTLLRIITIGASLSRRRKHPAFPRRLEANSPLLSPAGDFYGKNFVEVRKTIN